MKLSMYEYTGCGTCRKARKFLESNGISFAAIPIRETPPTLSELKRMLKYQGGNLRKLFNTSGLDYKALNLKDTLPAMSETQALQLLADNGNLVKRPFVLTAGFGLIGFNEQEWRDRLLKPESGRR